MLRITSNVSSCFHDERMLQVFDEIRGRSPFWFEKSKLVFTESRMNPLMGSVRQMLARDPLQRADLRLICQEWEDLLC